MRGRAAALLLAAAALTPRAAFAGPRDGGGDHAAGVPLADALYQRGKDLMAAGRYAEACESFAESNRLDPATGGTLLNLAVCHEKLGRVATATAEFEQARALARHFKRPDREQFAVQHMETLRSLVSTLTITVRDPTPGGSIALDGVVLGRIGYNA